MNVLHLHSHDTGRYVAPYGYDVPTPAISELAAGGVVFRQAFCAAPTCSASRAALLSGQCAHSAGMVGLAHRGFAMSDYRRHLAQFLRGAGFRTALVGQQHEARSADDIGYDQVVKVETPDPRRRNRAEHVAPAAESWLSSGPPEPFFLSVGFGQTHRQFPEPGPGDDPRWVRAPASIPDTPETRRDWAGFRTSAREMDAGYARVLAALDAAGLAERTLVICTTDHGVAFPEMKCSLYDGGIGVLLIMRGPGGFSGGRVLDSLVSHVDIFPTICELAGIAPPDWLQGRSLVPLVRGAAGEVNEEVFAEVSWHAAYEPLRAARTARWKYIRRFGGRARPVLPNCDDGPSKDVWLAAGWRERGVEEEELFDLLFDPTERRNLAGRAEHAAALAEMRGRLERWMRRTDDPLLAGPVPAPPGSIYNDPDGLSPNEEPRRVPSA